MGLGAEFANALPPPVGMDTGTITAVTFGGSVTVNVGGNLHPSKLISGAAAYKPAVGDRVLVLQLGNDLRVIGPVGPPLPDTGTVAASPGKSASTLTITVAGLPTGKEMPWVSSYTPVVSDKIAILWRGGEDSGLVLGKVGNAYANNPAPAPPPTAPPTVTTGRAVFTATNCGTYRDGVWRTDTDDVVQGTYPGYGPNQGVWFYSGQPHSTLAGATVTAAEIFLGRGSGGVFGPQTVHLYRSGENYMGSPPSFGFGPQDVALSVDQSGWYALNTTIAQQLIDLGGGVGIQGAPYLRMYGLSKSGSAGALRIDWRR